MVEGGGVLVFRGRGRAGDLSGEGFEGATHRACTFFTLAPFLHRNRDVVGLVKGVPGVK